MSYRYTRKCAEITEAHGTGLVDWGLDTYFLELFGFKVDYDPENVRGGGPVDKVSITSLGSSGDASAVISGDFDVHLELTALLTRFGSRRRWTPGSAGWRAASRPT